MKKQNGFSLIELITVIVILGVIVAMSSLLLSQGFNAFFNTANIADANSQGQLALERMSRDIRQIRSPSDITTATSTQLSFNDINNDAISYTLSGSNLTLTQNSTTQILAVGINSLTFTYYDQNGATPPASTAATRFIKVTLTVTQNNANFTVSTSIYPRNLT